MNRTSILHYAHFIKLTIINYPPFKWQDKVLFQPNFLI